MDGEDLTEQGVALAIAGKLAPVPIFVGSVAEDLTRLHARCNPTECSRSDFLSAARQAVSEEADAEAVTGLYEGETRRPTRGSAWYWAIQHAGADLWATCPSRRMARWYSKIGMESFWYFWSYIAEGQYTAHHSTEQPFVFHVLSETPAQLREEGPSYHIREDEVNFSANIVRTWAAMASRGRPQTGAVPWPSFNSSASGTALLLEGGRGTPGSFRPQENFMSAKCDFWDRMFFKENTSHVIDSQLFETIFI